jgi:hypothetical protein
MRVSHEPVGKLERAFDFGLRPGDPEPAKQFKDGPTKQGCPRIASAVNMIDTLTAKHTLVRKGLKADRIESYMEMGSLGRIAYQVGGMLSPFTSLPWVRAITAAQLSFLPDYLTQPELDQDWHVVVLEVENKLRERLVDWRWRTPHVYQFTAQLALAIAGKVATNALKGWVTPALALGPVSLAADKSLAGDTFLGCDGLEERQYKPLLTPRAGASS